MNIFFKKHYLLPAFLLSILVFQNSYPDDFHIIEGKNNEICQAYANRLNNLKLKTYDLMCERNIGEYSPIINNPNWRLIDAWTNKEIIKISDEIIYGHLDHLSRETWENKIKELIDLSLIKLYETYVDIDNDGVNEKAYRYFYNQCPDMPVYGIKIAIFDKNNNHIKRELTNSIINEIGTGLTLNIIKYKNINYFDVWHRLPNSIDENKIRGTLEIFKINSVSKDKHISNKQYNTVKKCEIDYQSSYKIERFP